MNAPPELFQLDLLNSGKYIPGVNADQKDFNKLSIFRSCMNKLYINVGSEKCCLFVKMSSFLLRALERNPLLYFAVEEALECAKIGYYAIGILTFSQLLNLFNRKTPASRHVVAHQILRQRPTKPVFEKSWRHSRT